ncbi:MAG: Lysine-specific demethylase 7A [Peltula sp. TS41687]|nr:MAG: Lysine-specific demethylase 7A [Peltula sp. TS41687]
MTSFKRSLYSHPHRPSRYRTPSPPVQSEIELLSPVSLKDGHADDHLQPRNGFILEGGDRRSVPAQKRTWEESTWDNQEEHGAHFHSYENDRDKRHKSLGSLPGTSAMDAFATIALAMSDSTQYPMSHLNGWVDHIFRQVKPQSPEEYSMVPPALGPASSYMPPNQPAKVRTYAPPINTFTERNHINTSAVSVISTADAELLLNVSRAAVLSPTTNRFTATHSAQTSLNGDHHTSHLESRFQTPATPASPTLVMNQRDSLPIPSTERPGQASHRVRAESIEMSAKPAGLTHCADGPSHEPPSSTSTQKSQRCLGSEPGIASNTICKSIEVNDTYGLNSRDDYNITVESRGHPETMSLQHTIEGTTCVTQGQPSLEVRRSDDQAHLIKDQPEAGSSTAYKQDQDRLGIKKSNASVHSAGNDNHTKISIEKEASSPDGVLIGLNNSHLVSDYDKDSPNGLPIVQSRDDSQLSPISSSLSKRRRGSAPEVFGGELTQITTISERRVDKKLVSEQPTPITGPLESIINPPVHPYSEMGGQVKGQRATCRGCRTLPNGTGIPPEDEEASWIGCDGCKQWFHFACAGLTAKEVRSVDKFSCRDCWDSHGPTTCKFFQVSIESMASKIMPDVRKSARTHTAIDYARLNEGVVKTSDESPNHPYIKPIKERTISFWPDNFPRVAPELITADFFEKGNGMREPVVIPVSMNPQRKSMFENEEALNVGWNSMDGLEFSSTIPQDDIDAQMTADDDYELKPDHGQDRLDMVIPQGLTVRQVAELYGPYEKVDVIDVKSQESASWTLKKWADYYEGKTKKQIKNVISLEVSWSKLGRLIKRPKVVRQLDLADSVWPPELKAKGDFPKVQLYCLMSVADSFTDFHIDFGGSSVFYHILKGKKTFLFIPPKSKHLKKYEQWCQSPVQQQTFLADQTKECYRVDLSAGDTMLIPSGWIHAVWTPEDSLVIGGNFLTRLHYGMQIQIAEIEKNTKVARKFRHPHFQKILWLTAIKYLKDDPLPSMVEKSLQDGKTFIRETPSYHEFGESGPSSKPGPENYQARYYSQHELDGLPDLVRYLFRTALIATGKMVDGITADTRQRVSRAIPKGHGDPLEIVKLFATWCAWKRGNEHIPAWAYANATIIDDMAKAGEKKLSAAAIKKMEREAAAEARRGVPRRQSQRKRGEASVGPVQALGNKDQEVKPTVVVESNNISQVIKLNCRKRDASTADLEDRSIGNASTDVGAVLTEDLPSKTDSLTPSPVKMSCMTCQQRGIVCEHQLTNANNEGDSIESSKRTIPSENTSDPPVRQTVEEDSSTSSSLLAHSSVQTEAESHITTATNTDISDPAAVNQSSQEETSQGRESSRVPDTSVATTVVISDDVLPNSSPSSTSSVSKRGRGNACRDCRRSKRRCVHNEDGKADPIKVKEAASKRSEYNLKRRLLVKGESESGPNKRQKLGPVQDEERDQEENLGPEQVPTPAVNGVIHVDNDEGRNTSQMDESAPSISNDIITHSEDEKRPSEEEVKEASTLEPQIDPFTLNHHDDSPQSPTPEPLSQPSSPLSELLDQILSSSPRIPTQTATQQQQAAMTTSSQTQSSPTQQNDEQEAQEQPKRQQGRRHSSRPRKRPEFFSPPAAAATAAPRRRSATPHHPTQQQQQHNSASSSSTPTKKHRVFLSPSTTTTPAKKNFITTTTTTTLPSLSSSKTTTSIENKKKRKANASSTIEQQQTPPKKKAKTVGGGGGGHKRNDRSSKQAIPDVQQQHQQQQVDEDEETMKLVREVAFGLRRR